MGFLVLSRFRIYRLQQFMETRIGFFHIFYLAPKNAKHEQVISDQSMLDVEIETSV